MTRDLHDHAGIPCSIGITDLCTAIASVLDSVQERFPRDFARIRERVMTFRLLTPDECADGTLGELKRRAPKMVPHPLWPDVLVPEEQVDEDYELAIPGVIALAPDANVGTVAHEFGHAATTYKDLERRQAPSDEWASELAADYFAYKWGFGKEIAKARPSADFVHHAVGPGQYVGLGNDWFHVSRRFVMHKCEPPQEGDNS